MHRAFILLLITTLLTTALPAIRGDGPTLTVSQIQGTGLSSPYEGKPITVGLRGCITGIAADGFFLQDPIGDGNTLSSDGIYVYRYSTWRNPRRLKPGDLVELSSYKVVEFYGQTEISGLPNDKNEAYRVVGNCTLPAPVLIPPPTDPSIRPAVQYEATEGARVAINLDASVVGPTQRFESRYPTGDPEITVVPRGNPFHGQRIFAAQLPIGRGTLALSGGLGVDLPQTNVFDQITAQRLTGILAFQFGRYVLLVDNPSEIKVERVSKPLPSIPPGGQDEWTACTFNAENLFDSVDDHDGDVGDWSPAREGQYEAGLQRRARLIRERLGGCTVLAMQEIEGKDAVWARMAAAVGPNYAFDYWESEDVRDITVGLIYDSTRVELRKSATVQACSSAEYGVAYVHAKGPRSQSDPCPDGTYPLYDRPPYVAELLVADAGRDRRAEVRLVVVHLKSKRGDEVENLARRVQQARHVATLMGAEQTIALGDFNDDLGSEPMKELRQYVNLFERHTPSLDRYTYIYNGRAQAVDHVVMTQEMDRYYLSGGPVHVNADFGEPAPGAEGRTSDHDPVLVRFLFRPTGVSDELLGAASGAAFGVPSDAYHQPFRLK